MKVELILFGDN